MMAISYLQGEEQHASEYRLGRDQQQEKRLLSYPVCGFPRNIRLVTVRNRLAHEFLRSNPAGLFVYLLFISAYDPTS